jgi:hypothetical protein
MIEPGGLLAMQGRKAGGGSAGGRIPTWSAVGTLAPGWMVLWAAHGGDEVVSSTKETEGMRVESASGESPGHTMPNPWLCVWDREGGRG